MDLAALHSKITEAISKLDLESVWPGFKPLRFALFNDAECCFDGRYIEKTDAFCANTSIVYEGEQIATWKASEETDISVLTSKLVHEMFHGFQTVNGWDCWPDEMEALYRYEYDAENLSLKLRENELLLKLAESFDEGAFRELLSLRRLRSENYPYQFDYEVRTEEIEGTANYVELQVLKQLDERKAAELMDSMRATMTEPSRLFPIRISCYCTGALMINALLGAGVYDFDAPVRPALLPILADVEPSDAAFPGRDGVIQAVTDAISRFNKETEGIIRSAVEKNDIVMKGPVELVFVNIYNARSLGGYLTSTFFLMYKDGDEQKMLPGNFVIKMKDGKTIDTVYR